MVPNEDDIYVCRCEESTWATSSVPSRQAACSVRDIKVRTNATMGVCQGMTCRRNIERMLREQKIELDLCCQHQRFPVRLLNVGDLTAITREEGDETCR